MLGLTTALGVIGLLGHLIAVPDIAHTVATMIGLAVGIDYALFLVTRHRTQLREGIEMHESIARAVGTAGTAVVFAGCTVVVALVSLVVAGIPLVSALGYTGRGGGRDRRAGRRSRCLPALHVAGRAVHQLDRAAGAPAPLRRPGQGRASGATGPASSPRRPWVPLIARRRPILVPLIIPVLDLRLGQENIGQTATSTMERQGLRPDAAGLRAGLQRPADRSRSRCRRPPRPTPR